MFPASFQIQQTKASEVMKLREREENKKEQVCVLVSFLPFCNGTEQHLESMKAVRLCVLTP